MIIETQNDGKLIDTKFYMQSKNNCKIRFLNINSLRHKFYPIMQMLHNQYFDILMLQEIKLDDSFPNAQFNIHGYCIMYVVIFLRRK